jgi:hypothetical protein
MRTKRTRGRFGAFISGFLSVMDMSALFRMQVERRAVSPPECPTADDWAAVGRSFTMVGRDMGRAFMAFDREVMGTDAGEPIMSCQHRGETPARSVRGPATK